MVVNGETAYRLIPGTANDGLMLRGDDPIAPSGPFQEMPQAKTIAVTGTNGPLRFSFFGMRVRGDRHHVPLGSSAAAGRKA